MKDDGKPPLSSTTRVVVKVEDVNDHGPEFEQKFYIVQIPASQDIDKPLFQVSFLSEFLIKKIILFKYSFKIYCREIMKISKYKNFEV